MKLINLILGEGKRTWRVDPEDSSIVSYGAENGYGDIRYFDTEEKARDFMNGKTKGKHAGSKFIKKRKLHKRPLRKTTPRTID
jgi:hypothetical protein